eukprot:3383742-Amphidinium_carterae.2
MVLYIGKVQKSRAYADRADIWQAIILRASAAPTMLQVVVSVYEGLLLVRPDQNCLAYRKADNA